ncbi:YcaO-like family protein [Streptomyces sp. NPDC051569]|uniref:YcaO-like family protein n=1 Tax=Streptomyces sp. NPDC051569 TaxID=3365661 RepID=UPI0037B72DEE
MIDVPRTLGRSGGIAVGYSLAPPQDAGPLWSVAVELLPVDGLDAGEMPPSARLVGASGHSRADALLRGAGEAVERYALHPVPGLATTRGAAGALDAPALAAFEPHLALAAPAAVGAVLDWVPGRRLRDDTTVMVPAPLVDWPSLGADCALFDPGPSGAAAGSSPRMALRSALLEIVERDAVLGAWERGLRLPAYDDPDQVDLGPAGTAQAGSAQAGPGQAGPGQAGPGQAGPAQAGSAQVGTAQAGPAHGSPGDRRSRTALTRLWRQARDRGITPRLARVPTAVPGLWCVIGSLVDPAGPGALATVGLKASDRPWDALLGAFQEAWQVRAALESSRAAGPRDEPLKTIVTEADRIHHMLTPDGYASVRDWVEGFVPAPGSPPAVDVSDEDILRAVLADGGDPVAVDLTPRLPPVLRSMGWCAVKVIPAGYQHLRMDESHGWSWNAPRLESAVARTGCEARYPGRSAARPHPLP